MPPKLIKALPVGIRSLGLDERWVQDRIAEDPGQLGLGDVFVRDKERLQPRAGRLDLLLQDSEEARRFEVEVQLGSTDECHIIRAIEYWDLERKRYPQYEHTAVLVAEDITTRFLNVMGLFNGQLPLVAIQMRALQVGDGVALVFTKVLDALSQGLVDDDEEVAQTADRAYWEKRARETLPIADRLLAIAREFAPDIEMTYLKGYIGVKVNGKAQNFYWVSPKKTHARLMFRMEQSDAIEAEIEQAGIDLVGHRKSGYRVRLTEKEVEKHRTLIAGWLKQAYSHFCE